MRLDHLLSKDWLCGGGFLAVCCLGRVGLGRLGGLPSRKGWAADRRALVCGVVGLSGAGIGDTPAVVGCCGCCGRGGLLVVGALACLLCVWGWHAVGVLGQCALVA